MIDYSKRLAEVDEILKYLSKSDYDKIPKEIKEVIAKNKDKEYEWKYDKTKKLKEQDIPNDTIAILSYINMEYLLNDEQKKFVKELHEQKEKKMMMNINYNADIFYKKNHNKTDKFQELVVKKKTMNFLQKLDYFIKKLFNKHLTR